MGHLHLQNKKPGAIRAYSRNRCRLLAFLQAGHVLLQRF